MISWKDKYSFCLQIDASLGKEGALLRSVYTGVWYF